MQKKNKNLQLLKKWLQDSSFYGKLIIQNEEKLKREGEKKALYLFHQASQRIPAYRAFLKTNKIHSSNVKTIHDFKQVPIITKENYIEKYDLALRCWDGILDSMHMISTSSGTTGKPHFWPRDLSAEVDGAYVHEFILKDICHIYKRKTLLINGFAMGNWIAGTFTLACATLVAWKGYPLTIMTPGYSLEAISELLRTISPYFEQTIIAGHIPFLKEIIETASKKMDVKKLHIIFLGTGQGITENWRKYILQLLSSENYYNRVINLYGSADTALMGFETPSSIYFRKILSEQIKIGKNIFHDERLPSLYSYDPRLVYFEEENRELCITKNGGFPLIRYNIHDIGGIITYNRMTSYFVNQKREELNNSKSEYKLPFVYLFGREKFMVKIYGANVYTEHVQHALNQEQLQPFITGRFVLETIFNETQDPELVVELNY